MIIWRGWGIVPILIAGAAVGLGAAMTSSLPAMRGFVVGLMLIAGAVGCWFLGHWLNVQRPNSEFEAWFAHRRAEVAALVRGGAYSAVADPQRPGELADPWAVGQHVLDRETAAMKSAMSNRHSLFFVPIQYVGFAMALAGLLVIGLNLIGE